MQPTSDRRSFLFCQGAALIGFAGIGGAARAEETRGATAEQVPQEDEADGAWPGFPHQDPALVRAIVGASHRNVDRVKALLSAHPALANAAYDWGFGDWETALGAASHVGNRAIALTLLEHGAQLDIFAATMLGMTDVVKAMLTAQPLLVKTRGPHGISLIAHAEAGENAELVAYLGSLEGSGVGPALALTPAQSKVYLGKYIARGDHTIVISENRFGLALKGDEGTECRLTHLGEHTFHPAGAPNVRVTFTVGADRASALEIREADWLVSATRGE